MNKKQENLKVVNDLLTAHREQLDKLNAKKAKASKSSFLLDVEAYQLALDLSKSVDGLITVIFEKGLPQFDYTQCKYEYIAWRSEEYSWLATEKNVPALSSKMRLLGMLIEKNKQPKIPINSEYKIGETSFKVYQLSYRKFKELIAGKGNRDVDPEVLFNRLIDNVPNDSEKLKIFQQKISELAGVVNSKIDALKRAERLERKRKVAQKFRAFVKKYSAKPSLELYRELLAN